MEVAAVLLAPFVHHGEFPEARVFGHPVVDRSVLDCQPDHGMGIDVGDLLAAEVDRAAIAQRTPVLFNRSQCHRGSCSSSGLLKGVEPHFAAPSEYRCPMA